MTIVGEIAVKVKPDADGFGNQTEKQLADQLEAPVKKSSDKISALLKGAFVGAAVAGIGAFARSAIGAASDIEESVSKVNVVFGDSAESVLALGKNAAESLGQSEAGALSAAGTFGNLLRSLKLSEDQAAQMSVSMVQLASDLASFNNTSPEEALEALRSGLVGETEPLKAFGVNLNEATIKQEAMNLGLFDGVGTLDAASKAQASYSLIMQQTTLAQGDFARTSEGVANSQRILAAKFEDTKAAIGAALLPAFNALLGSVEELLPVIESLGPTIGALGEFAAAVIGPLAGLAGGLVGSDFGGFAIGAGGAALVLSNAVIPALGKASEALQKLGAAQVGAGGAIAIFATIVAGAGFSIYQAIQRDAAEAAEASDRLGTAMEEGADPAFTLRTQALALAEAMGKITSEAGPAEQAVLAWDAAHVQAVLTQEDLLGVVAKIPDGFDRLALAMRNGTDSVASIKGELYELVNAGAITQEEVEALIAVIDREGEAWAAQSEITAKAQQNALDVAQAKGVLTAAEVEAAKSARGATDETFRTTQAYEALLPQISAYLEANGQIIDDAGNIVAADKSITEATAGLGEQFDLSAFAAERAARAQEDLDQAAAELSVTMGLSLDQARVMVQGQEEIAAQEDIVEQATKDLEAAYDAAHDAQDRWLGVTFGFQEGLDAVTLKTRDLTATVLENAGAVGVGTEAFEGNSGAAINNRAAMIDVIETARDTINSYDDLGLSTADATAQQQLLAQAMYDDAIAMGAPIGTAELLRARILEIPPEHNTDVVVHEQGLAAVKAGLAEVEAREYHAYLTINTAFMGLDAAGIQQTIRDQGIIGAAKGAVVGSRPGGSLLWVGEGGEDEVIAPLPRGFMAAMVAISEGGGLGGVGGGGDFTYAPQLVFPGVTSRTEAGAVSERVLANLEAATVARRTAVAVRR